MNLCFEMEEICYILIREKMSEYKWKHWENHVKPSDSSVPLDLNLNQQPPKCEVAVPSTRRRFVDAACVAWWRTVYILTQAINILLLS